MLQFEVKYSRRAWHVIPAQEVKGNKVLGYWHNIKFENI